MNIIYIISNLQFIKDALLIYRNCGLTKSKESRYKTRIDIYYSMIYDCTPEMRVQSYILAEI